MTIKQFSENVNKLDPDEEFMLLSEICWTKGHKSRVNTDKEFSDLNRYVDILPCNFFLYHLVNDTRIILP